jgi:hypothetical protein
MAHARPQLLTLDEAELVRSGQEYARKIDQFLIHREQSMLSKLHRHWRRDGTGKL